MLPERAGPNVALPLRDKAALPCREGGALCLDLSVGFVPFSSAGLRE